MLGQTGQERERMYGKRKRCEVLVVGAGPVGQLAALVLLDRGIDVALVDEAERSTGRSYAAAVHPKSLDLLADIGVADALLAQSRRVDTVAFYEGHEQRACVDLGELESKYPFVAVTPQSALQTLLEGQLRQRGVPILWHHRAAAFELMGDRAEVEVDVLDRPAAAGYARGPLRVEQTLTFDVRYLVGADGRDSLVRRGSGIGYRPVGSSEQYDVFEFESVQPSGSEVSVVLDDRTANVLWTLPGSRQRWTLQVAEPGTETREQVKRRLSMQVPGESSPKRTAAVLRQLVEQRAPWFDASVEDIAWAGEVHFERRLADSLGRGAVWLAGDAAHQASPIGVQSMNVGLLEAVELGSRLTDILRKRVGAEVLQDWGATRLAAWQWLLGIGRAFRATAGANDWVRRRAERLVGCLPASGEHLLKLLAQLGLVE